MTNDRLLFFEDQAAGEIGANVMRVNYQNGTPPWRILVVDDDSQVHAVTRLSLSQFRFEDREIALFHASSASAARDILDEVSDIAMVFLDVVMETADAGLQLVRTIRQHGHNHLARIVLRTGHSGLASKKQMVIDYDINDYQSKADLTHERLLLSTITALRSYRDITAARASHVSLQRIADSAVDLFQTNALNPLLDTALRHLDAIVGGTGGSALCACQTHHLTLTAETTLVVGLGRFSDRIGLAAHRILSASEQAAVDEVIATHRHIFTPSRIVLALYLPERWSGAVLIPVNVIPSGALKHQIGVYLTLIRAALDNVYRLDDLRRSNRATVVALADLAENRDTDTGDHVSRVARLTAEIARELVRRGHPEIPDALYVEQVGLASMLHDLGKVGIPDNVLHKCGALTPVERTLMETHTLLGGKTLEKARQVVTTSNYLNLGWEIATGHHEAFDGSGYPFGRKGGEIPLSARIVAVADVYDALTSARSYKTAWQARDASDFIVKRRGTQFDPVVVDAFLAAIANRTAQPYICWTPAMSVGDPRLDADHLQLIALINQLAAADADTDRASVEFVLDELIQYTLVHFAREEDLLARIGYPDLAEHRNAHAALVDQVAALRARAFNGLSVRLSADILEFLSIWLRTHILKEDRKYAARIMSHSDRLF